MVVGRSTGGIGVHVVDLVTRLRELGDDVFVVTDELTATRFGIADARRWWPVRGSGIRGALSYLRRMRGLTRSSDVVHAHGHQAGLFAVLAAVGTGTPVVVSQHNAVLGGRGRGPSSAACSRPWWPGGQRWSPARRATWWRPRRGTGPGRRGWRRCRPQGRRAAGGAARRRHEAA